MSRRSFPFLLAFGLMLAPPLAAEQLITDVSHETVSITSNFTGTRVVVFGAIERDSQTVARSEPYDVAVVIEGPGTTLVTRKKERRFGIWINTDSARMVRVPSYLAVLSNRPLAEIAPPQLRARIGLGLDMLPLNGTANENPPVRTDFEEAFLRLMQDSHLYQQTENGAAEFRSKTLFRAPVALPATVPVGRYVATVHLFRGGALLASQTTDFRIGKVGFEQFMTRFAREHGAFYGLTAVMIACLTGWIAGIVFRRD